MKKINDKDKDKIIYICSLFGIVIPITLFFLGFIKLYLSIPITLIIMYLTHKVISNYKKQNYKPQKKYWIVACTTLFLWLLFSGIGDFTYQNVIDFHVRHAILRDLINYDWPVIYKDYGLVYYLSYFLPAALVGKIFTYKIANKFLFLYSYIFIINILYLINRYLKKDSYLTLIMFILFSGLDIIGMPNYLFSTTPLEWWNGLFQYSSNTTSLYWVFNQSLPIWIIVALILNMDNGKDIIFISSISFFYSPYATICIIPIVIYLFFKYSSNKKKDILSLNVLISLIFAIILGLYYMSGNGSQQSGFIFEIVKDKNIILPSYILFIILEIGLFIIPTWKYYKNEALYKIVIIELLIIPIYVITENNDLCMRGSTPILFILMIYFCKYMTNKKYHKKTIIYILLLISFITPAHEIFRSVINTFTTNNYIADDIISIGNPKKYKELVSFQFYGNLESLFFKYIAK